MKNYFMNLFSNTESKLRQEAHIRTYTGQNFYPFNPKYEDIFIEDIAHSLAMQCRFNGHTSHFYSVAQHSLLASYLCDKGYEFECLMHDSPETYTVDVPTPIKRRLKGVLELEEIITKSINEKFDLPFPMTEHAKEIDNLLFRIEWVYLMSGENFWNEKFSITKEEFLKLIDKSPSQVEKEFLDRFKELYEKHNFSNPKINPIFVESY